MLRSYSMILPDSATDTTCARHDTAGASRTIPKTRTSFFPADQRSLEERVSSGGARCVVAAQLRTLRRPDPVSRWACFAVASQRACARECVAPNVPRRTCGVRLQSRTTCSCTYFIYSSRSQYIKYMHVDVLAAWAGRSALFRFKITVASRYDWQSNERPSPRPEAESGECADPLCGDVDETGLLASRNYSPVHEVEGPPRGAQMASRTAP